MKTGVDYIGVSVFALIFNQKNEVLLINHYLSDKKPEDFSNCWTMPGGTVDFGETAISTLKREIKEELDLDIFDEELINYNDWIKCDRHWVALNFKAKTIESPKNLEPEKIKEIGFFRLDSLPENLSEFCRECISII